MHDTHARHAHLSLPRGPTSCTVGSTASLQCQCQICCCVMLRHHMSKSKLIQTLSLSFAVSLSLPPLSLHSLSSPLPLALPPMQGCRMRKHAHSLIHHHHTFVASASSMGQSWLAPKYQASSAISTSLHDLPACPNAALLLRFYERYCYMRVQQHKAWHAPVPPPHVCPPAAAAVARPPSETIHQWTRIPPLFSRELCHISSSLVLYTWHGCVSTAHRYQQQCEA